MSAAFAKSYAQSTKDGRETGDPEEQKEDRITKYNKEGDVRRKLESDSWSHAQGSGSCSKCQEKLLKQSKEEKGRQIHLCKGQPGFP